MSRNVKIAYSSSMLEMKRSLIDERFSRFARKIKGNHDPRKANFTSDVTGWPLTSQRDLANWINQS